MQTIIALDFEASCLPCRGRSYPIEVGISDIRGHSRSWLIRPVGAWRTWTWTEEAEGLHGIARDQLEAEGQPPATVLSELAAACAGARVIADSVLDADWLATLAAATGRAAPFSIDHAAVLLEEIGATVEQIGQAEAVISALRFRRHRAGPDARYLGMLIGEVGRTLRAERPLFDW